ncbi:MAG: hypothetical protein Q9M35_10340 [Rhodothermus sp.]|nr:hypothetical protein [Rhodothermus sp.]
MGAEIDLQGGTAVLDFANGAVRFFDSAGNYLFTIGSAGEGPGELERLAIDRQGRLYVLDGDRGHSKDTDIPHVAMFQLKETSVTPL